MTLRAADQATVRRRLALAGVAMTPHLSGVSSDADGVIVRNIYTERDERREGVGPVVMGGYRHDGLVHILHTRCVPGYRRSSRTLRCDPDR